MPPRNAAERAVAALWAELLEIPADSVGVHDDFFARGGSSLLLAQLAARLRADGARVAPGDLFAAATVESQAALAAAAPRGAAVPDGPDRPVVPVPRPVEGLPLASGQRGMWLLDQISPGSPEWVSPQWMRLPAAWSEETVRKALTRLADRHEILRTHYTARSGTPVQQVRAPGGPVSLDVVRTDTREDVEELTGRELARGFDLEEGPVWRSVLLPGATAPGEDGADHLLLLLTHHICCDGWSSVLLERDLLAFARALHTGTETVLPDVPVQFADHAAWELSRGEEALAGDLAHWRTVLDGVTPLDLPTDRTRPAERQGLGGMVAKALPAGLAGSAAALGRSRGATLHQTLLTAFCVLLTRLTGRNDVTIGMPVAGRHRPETAQTVGFFLNTLVLRCRTDAGGSGFDALETVRDTVLEALAHQEVPFDRLVRELEPGRDPSRTPLHQVTFDFHEEGRTATALPEPALAALSHGWRTSRTDLALLVQERPDGSLLARAHYDSALFDRATAERFLDCWMQLLESLVTSPTAPLDSLALLPESEHERLIAIGAPKDADPGTAACVYTAFAETARRIPEATAVECGEQRLGYAELHARAAAVADALRVHGAGAERTVAVLLPRSADLVAAFLGIWRSGAAAVPLDVESPDDRLAHIVSDADVTAVLTDAAGARRLAAHYAGPCVITDSLTPRTAPPTPGEPVSEIDRSASRLAYVIYTSGTTGRPKGVAVEHQALHRMLRAGGAHLRFGEGVDDAWLALATPTFDIAFTELVMPLLAGGRIVVAREEETTDAPALLKLMDHHGVTHVQVGHPQWRTLIDAGLGTRALTGQTGGEPCPPSLARDLAGRLTRFVNEYGLTETTIAATRAEITTRSATVPVGSPYPHTTARVLDPMLRPVPPGTVGELCIGGHGLFRGYLADPARTASRLLPDPYGPPGSRLLRTGDLARMEPDGTLHFMGRADGQVKIRGRRVETEEVRSVLIDHPAVGEAVVTARGSGEETRLVAYCVPAAGRELPYAGELLDHCATSLPEYMLPTYIVPIEKVPLTRHRKVDIAALPDPDRTAADREESYVAPEGDLEEALVRIWGEVLAEPGGTPPRIGTRTGFFRLGGDSLRAARLIARIREVYGVRLAPRTVFDQPTVAGLARAVEEAVRAELAQLSDEELEAAQEEFRP
ncbi:amino acid adenylation domain-containing protein [Streptomyces sp. NPDC059752]|uniref:non-ribosomal peptide synthetase n=1 Tax=unclassified Streptomyces TaxID=2593676 RepID=UPI003665582D